MPPIPWSELQHKQFLSDSSRWLIGDGLLTKTGTLMIGGPPKSYKSFVMATIISHLCTGTNLFGTHRRPHGRDEACFPVTSSHRVLLFEQEIGYESLQERWRPLAASYNPAQQELLAKNLSFYSQDWDLRFDTPIGLARIHSLIAEVKPDIIAFDPFVEFHLSDENSTQEMSKVLHAIEKIKQAFQCAVILSHHTGKPDPSKQRSGPDQLRGNSVIFGKGDSFIMTQPVNRNTGQIKIHFTIRRGKPIDSLNLLLDFNDLRMKFHSWHSSNTKFGRNVDLDTPIM